MIHARQLAAGRLILIRHGETDDNVRQRLCGWTDSALSARGLEQTRRLGMHVQVRYRIDRLYTSPLQRAWLTAHAIAAAAGPVPVAVDDLREIYFGELEGMELADFERAFPDFYQRWRNGDSMDLHYPGGETRRQFRERVARALAPLEIESRSAVVAVVCHGGVIGSYLAHRLTGDPGRWRDFHVHNRSITEIGWQDGHPVVVRQNCVEHLTET
jgi:broad specificity phosphatase PhoE